MKDERHLHVQTLQTRYALRIAAQLTEHTNNMPADIVERLRFAREQALARAADAVASPPVNLVAVSGTSMALGQTGGGRTSWWSRLGVLIPLLTLVAGLVMIEEFNESSQIRAAAEVDTALLADDLPPGAYADPGFVEYLTTAPRE